MSNEPTLVWGFGYSARLRRLVIDGRETIVIGDRTRAKQIRVWMPALMLIAFVFGCVGLFPPNASSQSMPWWMRLGFGILVPGVLIGVMLLLRRGARREPNKVFLTAYDDVGVLIATRRGERVALRQDLTLQPGKIERSLVFGARGRRATVFLCELGIPLFPIVCTKDAHRQHAETMFLDTLGIEADPEPILYWLEEKTTFLQTPDPAMISVTLHADEETTEAERSQ